MTPATTTSVKPVLVPQANRRVGSLPPMRRSSILIPALAAENRVTIGQMLKKLNVSQWMLLLYPLFLMAVHRRRDEADVAVVDSSALLQIGLTAICGVWILNRLLSSLKSFERVLFNSPLRWLTAYAILAVLSAAWADMASLTVFRGAQVLIFLMLTADAIGSLRSPQEMIRLQLLYAAMVILFWQLPRLSMGLSLTSLHTSDVAGMLSVPVFIGVLVRGKQWRILHVGICALWGLSTSSGSMCAVIGGIAISLMLMRGRASGIGMFLIGAMVLAPLLAPDDVGSVVFFGKNETNIRTATGRLPIWQWILEERVAARPVLGFGFGEGEVQARLYNIGGFRMMHMHNGFMSAVVNLGVCGVALWALMWGAMARAAWSVRQSNARIVMVGALVTLFLNTLSVESVTAPLSMPWIGHALFFATLAIAAWDQTTTQMSVRANPVTVPRVRFGATKPNA
jgi:hypothetical protein